VAPAAEFPLHKLEALQRGVVPLDARHKKEDKKSLAQAIGVPMGSINHTIHYNSPDTN